MDNLKKNNISYLSKCNVINLFRIGTTEEKDCLKQAIILMKSHKVKSVMDEYWQEIYES
jgi:hypothetical protein